MENNKIVAEYFIFDVKKEFVINKKKSYKAFDDKDKIYYYFKCEWFRSFEEWNKRFIPVAV